MPPARSRAKKTRLKKLSSFWGGPDTSGWASMRLNHHEVPAFGTPTPTKSGGPVVIVGGHGGPAGGRPPTPGAIRPVRRRTFAWARSGRTRKTERAKSDISRRSRPSHGSGRARRAYRADG